VDGAADAGPQEEDVDESAVPEEESALIG
jgi:hypothetical protein